MTLIRTAGERMIALRYDTCSPRPASGWEQLQGTKGCYQESAGRPLVYLEDRTKRHEWEALELYGGEFEHPFWREDGQRAANTGHGGGDYFVLREFYSALREDREPPIDVYDGATWSAVLPLSGRSIISGNQPVEIPDFTRGAWKNRTLEGFGIRTQAHVGPT